MDTKKADESIRIADHHLKHLVNTDEIISGSFIDSFDKAANSLILRAIFEELRGVRIALEEANRIQKEKPGTYVYEE
jgi:hypothetical protein